MDCLHASRDRQQLVVAHQVTGGKGCNERVARREIDLISPSLSPSAPTFLQVLDHLALAAREVGEQAEHDVTGGPQEKDHHDAETGTRCAAGALCIRGIFRAIGRVDTLEQKPNH